MIFFVLPKYGCMISVVMCAAKEVGAKQIMLVGSMGGTL
jgi:hypothetical protein